MPLEWFNTKRGGFKILLEKAIELSKESERSLRSHKFIDHADAIKLGTEALKAIQEERLGNPLLDGEMLPSNMD